MALLTEAARPWRLGTCSPAGAQGRGLAHLLGRGQREFLPVAGVQGQEQRNPKELSKLVAAQACRCPARGWHPIEACQVGYNGHYYHYTGSAAVCPWVVFTARGQELRPTPRPEIAPTISEQKRKRTFLC